MAAGLIFTCLDFDNKCTLSSRKVQCKKMLILVTSCSFGFNAEDCGTDCTSSLLLFVKYAVLVCYEEKNEPFICSVISVDQAANKESTIINA